MSRIKDSCQHPVFREVLTDYSPGDMFKGVRMKNGEVFEHACPEKRVE